MKYYTYYYKLSYILKILSAHANLQDGQKDENFAYHLLLCNFKFYCSKFIEFL